MQVGVRTPWPRIWRIAHGMLPGSRYSRLREIEGSDGRAMVIREMNRQFATRELMLIRSRVFALFIVMYVLPDLQRPMMAMTITIFQLLGVLYTRRVAQDLLDSVDDREEAARLERNLSLVTGFVAFLWAAFFWTFSYSAMRTPSEFMLTLIIGVATVLLLMEAAYSTRAFVAAIIGASLGILPAAAALSSQIGFAPTFAFVLFAVVMTVFAHMIQSQARRVTLLQIQHERLSRRLAQANMALKSSLGKMRTIAHSDPLTGLGNRRWFSEQIADLQQKAVLGTRFAVILFDVDYFKRVNDQYGHDAGDAVLIHLGRQLRRWEAEGPHRLAARWGGEEFVTLVRLQIGDCVSTVLEQLRVILAVPGNDPIWPAELHISVSLGCSEAVTPFDLHREISRADRALYLAKESGRDCYRVAA